MGLDLLMEHADLLVGQALLQLRPVLSGIEFVGKVEQERGDNDGKDSKKQAVSVKIQADGCPRGSSR